MKVYLGVPRGFCAGVVRAVDVVNIALERFGAPVYVKHQIVHNPYVVKSLEEKGAVTVEDVNEIPYGSTVVFSAHGSPPDDFAMARNRELNIIDATSPTSPHAVQLSDAVPPGPPEPSDGSLTAYQGSCA